MRHALAAFESSLPTVPVHVVDKQSLAETLADLPASVGGFAKASGFEAAVGQVLVVPDADGAIATVLFGVANATDPGFALGDLARKLPGGTFRIVGAGIAGEAAALAFALGSYRFERYRKPSDKARPVLMVEPDVDLDAVLGIVAGVQIARDLVNTPANDLGPEELATAAITLFGTYGGSSRVVEGEALLEEGFPMIHAVGRASTRAPRLIDATWGDETDPKVTLVGKGVIFDTGGLDIKPASAMTLMKKDMGGAANVLALAAMVMDAELPVRLRVIIPAVENAISGNAFRPGDILPSRKGITVEIGNTDAEGRLVLADALALADEEEPEILLDMATLTGAARVALGPELPPFYTDDEDFASDLAARALKVSDPLWRLPLWRPYESYLESRVADINHINTSGAGFAGSVTAALFLARFVEKAKTWAHFDIYAWNPSDRPARPAGGEAQAVRALFDLLKERYGGSQAA
ncbi:MAG: leucyl aminopeptidase [Stappia sp.]|uniref:leucyl aminopeptidase family protein n=1 Tax=Stappia sp. TaxID=1870903 RepID=UPI000C5096BF|nr:leucyl aminopeptidase family protein [Stappia sp.]MAB00244.1 leucyl aminopeptidase [Stappia sp.]MBM21031.1 leucyl aminopeptidase [Stappia sp.]